MSIKYCSLSDVQTEYRKISFSDKTSPTKSNVENWIIEKSNIINARICARYLIPIPVNKKEARDVIKRICIDMVSSEIEDILNQGRTVPTNDEKRAPQKTRGEKMAQSAEAMIVMIEAGRMQLTGIERSDNGSAFNSNSGKTIYNPKFRKGVRQW